MSTPESLNQPEDRSHTELLRELPVHAPPPQLWERILETRLEQERRRRRYAVGFSLAVTATAAVLVVAVMIARPTAESALQHELSALIAHSQLLEERLRVQEARFRQLDRNQRSLANQQQARLIAIDQALARAYGRGASDLVLEPLWQQRGRLIAALLQTYEQQSTGQRI